MPIQDASIEDVVCYLEIGTMQPSPQSLETESARPLDKRNCLDYSSVEVAATARPQPLSNPPAPTSLKEA
ncbi:MAG: hypothetical protein JW755_08800 [Candidatus Aminicenantes bacterium]|nr:hypothetical protein [Candidatus Aminicenantes bacterium]